jgi:hypothetical protein
VNDGSRAKDILVDDVGHDDDLLTAVDAAVRGLGVDDSVVTTALNWLGWDGDLRAWLARTFFPEHLAMYTSGRRKAPIYWQLATASAGYSVWVYIHAFTDDTLFRVQNDYITPKLIHEERRLEAMTREVREKGSAAERKALVTQEALVEELRTFLRCGKAARFSVEPEPR